MAKKEGEDYLNIPQSSSGGWILRCINYLEQFWFSSMAKNEREEYLNIPHSSSKDWILGCTDSTYRCNNV